MIRIEGADSLARTLDQVADQLDDLTDLHAQLGDLVVTAAGPLTPVRTGVLRAGTTAVAARDETTIVNAVRYAPYVNARVDFIGRAQASTEARQLDTAERHIQHLLNQVKGA